MALAFISGTVIGGLFGALLRYVYDLRVLRDYRRRVDTIEKRFIGLIPDIPRVAYICDGKACAECNPDCHHTFNINHARNFECIAENEYWEKEPTTGRVWR